MVEFINKLTGTAMFVADERVEEYKAAGHKLAAKSSEAPKKKTTAAKKPAKKK